MRSRPAASWFGLDRPWPPALRTVAGGAAGWAAIRWGVTESIPAWARGGAAAVSAAGGLAAPAVARGVGATVVSGWAAVSALGLYLGVPETDHVVGVAAVLVVLVLASIAAPGRASWVPIVGLDVVLAWAAVRGAPDGGPALAAALTMPGLLIVAPLTSYLPGPRRAIVPASVQPAALVGLQAGFALVVARVAARTDTITAAATIAADRGGRARRGRPPRRRIPVMVKRAIDIVVAATLLVVTAPLLAAHRVRGADRRRSAGAVPPGSKRSRRPAVRARQVPHDATGRARRSRSAARRGAPDPGRSVPAGDEPRRAADAPPRGARRHVARRAAAAAGDVPVAGTTTPRPAGSRSGRASPGWAQVNGRNTTQWDERLAMDVWYVDHASLALDVRILARTVGLVLRGEGIDYAPGVTMTEFRRSRRPSRPQACRSGRCVSLTSRRSTSASRCSSGPSSTRSLLREVRRSGSARRVRSSLRSSSTGCGTSRSPRRHATGTRGPTSGRRPSCGGSCDANARRCCTRTTPSPACTGGSSVASPEYRSSSTPSTACTSRRRIGSCAGRSCTRSKRSPRAGPMSSWSRTSRTSSSCGGATSSLDASCGTSATASTSDGSALMPSALPSVPSSARRGASTSRRWSSGRSVDWSPRRATSSCSRRFRISGLTSVSSWSAARMPSDPTPSTRRRSSGRRLPGSCCSVTATTSTGCSAASTCSFWPATARGSLGQRWKRPHQGCRSWRPTCVAAVKSSTTGRPDCSCPWPTPSRCAMRSARSPRHPRSGGRWARRRGRRPSTSSTSATSCAG